MPTKYPPKLSLNEAVNVIRTMYQQHQAREIPTDLMPEILDTKQSSSFFPSKISALQIFGFVEKMPNDILYLTELGMQVVKPIGDSEVLEAKIMAFKKVDVLSDLLLKYPNGKLPSSEALQKNLLNTYSLDRDKVKLWYDFVVDSFNAISEIADIPLYPATLSIPKSTPIISTAKTAKFERQILPSGKEFEYNLESGYTSEDVDYVIGLFELKKKTMK